MLPAIAPSTAPIPTLRNPPSLPAHFLSLLNQPHLQTLTLAKSIHAQILKHGLSHNIKLATRLHSLYSASDPNAALALFTVIDKTELLTWNLLITASMRAGQPGHCLDLYAGVLRAGFHPDEFTLPCVLNACKALRDLSAGRAVQGVAFKLGLVGDPFVVSALVDLYAGCGLLDVAEQVFDESTVRDLPTWNSVITGFTRQGEYHGAVRTFFRMRLAAVNPNRTTLSGAITACARLPEFGLGKAIHAFVLKLAEGTHTDVSVNSSLVFLYSKFEDLDSATRVFRTMPDKTVVSWNSIINGHAHGGNEKDAWDLFLQMQMEGLDVSEVTLLSMLVASDRLLQGRMMHGYSVKIGLVGEEIIGAGLIDMYVRCGNVTDARKVFDEEARNEMGSWNSLILGYARTGYPREALKLFSKLRDSGLRPNSFTLVGVLSACASLGGLRQGEEIHRYIVDSGMEMDLYVETALVDMYAKCGSVEVAREMFEGMRERDLATLSVMISGHGMNGQVGEAIDLFERMVKEEGIRPDNMTFTSILSVCSHAGLIQEGKDYFNQMEVVYGLEHKTEQYACMVDLFGRAGKLEEALSFIEERAINPDVSVWGALLGACRIHNNVELGAYAAEKLFELDPDDAGYYVLLSNLHASKGRWNDVIKVRELMKSKRLEKSPGCSWLDLGSDIHEFYAGDKSHPQSDMIYEKLEELGARMKELGYIANTNLVLHDVNDELKEDMLSSHSERLAVAFGLINVEPSEPVRVTKNLRICGDCHHAMKFISVIAGRKIILRDARRFHHFEKGECSCRDYW